MTNLEIQAINRKLSKMANVFSHVAVVETDLNRNYFTQHGTHLNKSRKEWLSKLIATHICRLAKSNNGDVPVIALNWKNETADKQNTVNVHKKSKISPDQNNRLPSKRARRLPTTKHGDFSWLDISMNQ
jgi:hypothetical protein